MIGQEPCVIKVKNALRTMQKGIHAVCTPNGSNILIQYELKNTKSNTKLTIEEQCFQHTEQVHINQKPFCLSGIHPGDEAQDDAAHQIWPCL